MNHDLDFKYCTSSTAYHLWTFGLFAVCFGVPVVGLLVAMRLGGWVAAGHWVEAVSVIVGLMVLCVYEGVLAERIAGRFTQRDGTARFSETGVEIVLAERTVQLRYDEIAALEYEKIVGTTALWDFLPTAKLTIRLKGGLTGKPANRRLVIRSSQAEAKKAKKEHGISPWKTKMWNRDGSSVVVPETSLWPLCNELGRRTELTVQVNEKIEDTSIGV